MPPLSQASARGAESIGGDQPGSKRMDRRNQARMSKSRRFGRRGRRNPCSAAGRLRAHASFAHDEASVLE